MKIAIVVDEIAPGGMAKILAYPITYLKRKGHKVKLIAIIEKKTIFFLKKYFMETRLHICLMLFLKFLNF